MIFMAKLLAFPAFRWPARNSVEVVLVFCPKAPREVDRGWCFIPWDPLLLVESSFFTSRMVFLAKVGRF